MNNRKSVIKGVRVTKEADAIIEGICRACNFHQMHVNGEEDVTASTLLSFIFERLASSSPDEKEGKIAVTLSDIFFIKNIHGRPASTGELQMIARDSLK